MKEAMFYKKIIEDKVKCTLCPHNCTITNNKRGLCGVRENNKGVLYSLNYKKAIAASVDPIEKKPLFHFLPGTNSYSIAAVGCNMTCLFCQNSEISQDPKPNKQVMGEQLSPEEIIKAAIAADCKSISYTYTEPTIFFEYAYDTAVLARKAGLKNIFVTNGFTSPDAIDKITEVLDAANIDLKGFTDEFYRDYCGARLQPVLDAIKQYKNKGIHIEITTLIIPGHNDTDEMLQKIAGFISQLSKDIPWHISRSYPFYKMQDTSQTPIETIKKAIEIGKDAGIKHIHPGNI